MALRLAVSCRKLVPGRIGGLEHSFRDTFDALLERHGGDFEITLLTSSWCHDAFPAWRDRVRRRHVRSERALRRALRDQDVLYCPFAALEPLRPPLPAVVQIPDLQHVAHPEWLDPGDLAARLRDTRASAAYADRVVTVSEASRRDLLAAYHLPDDHVVVAPLDCAPAFRRPADPERAAAVRRRFGLPEDYLLFPAHPWPHKNHRGAFRALARYRERHGDAPHLVLTGAGVGAVDLRGEARACGLADRVHLPGHVDGDLLPDLYDGARALLFPSLFEGFGIPLVEAMRRGVPIVAADRTAIPEVTGDAAELADPTDPDALAAALHRVLADPGHARALAERGRRHAERYSYAHTADTLAGVLTEAATSGGGIPRPRPAAVRPEARPSVFVVTPSYNQGAFLRDAIDSVLAQDHRPLDYLVGDGGSTDDSVAVLESYGDRVRWRSGPDGGQAACIAAAWRNTDAEIVAWLNSDDTLLPGAVRAAADHLLAHPELHMVYGEGVYTDRDGERTGRYPTRPWAGRRLRELCYICQPTVFLRREVFQVIDLPDPALRYAMDYDLWIRVAQHFRIGHLPRELATSRLYEETKTLGERDGVFREVFAVLRRHYGRPAASWYRGYALYKARRLVERMLWFLPGPLQRRLYDLGLKLRGRTHPRGLPPYPDGWLAPRARVEVATDDQGWATLELAAPEALVGGRTEVRVEHDGTVLARARLRDTGPVTLVFAVPPRRALPTVVDVLTNRGIAATRAGGTHGDAREVALRLLAQRPGRS